MRYWPPDKLAAALGTDTKKVLVTGCFDVIHVGHIRLFKTAAQLGTTIIGLNVDSTVTKLKGPGHPRFSMKLRAEVLNMITPVHYITYFEEDNPSELIRRLRPHYFVRGAEYKVDEVPEKDALAAVGCTWISVPMAEIPGVGEIHGSALALDAT